MRNIHRAGFPGWFLLIVAFNSGIIRLKDRYGAEGHPLWLAWFGLAGLAILFILLIAVSVWYVRGENRLREAYWSVERTPFSWANCYWHQMLFACAATPLVGVAAGMLSSSLPDRLLVPCFSPFFILLALMFSSVILYLYEGMRVAEGAYLDFARQLGVDVRTLDDLKSHSHDFQSPRYGLWAEAVVTHRGHQITFGGGQIGNLPCFVLILETHTDTQYSSEQLTQAMSEETKHRFTNIQSKIKRVDLEGSEGAIFLSVPLLSRRISVELLRDAMDVLVDIAREVHH